jgi:hypothetical protein
MVFRFHGFPGNSCRFEIEQASSIASYLEWAQGSKPQASPIMLYNLQYHRTRHGGCCQVCRGYTVNLYLTKALAGLTRCAWNRCLRDSRDCTEVVAVSNPCSSKSLSFYGKAYHTCNSQQHASEALRPPPALTTTHFRDSP